VLYELLTGVNWLVWFNRILGCVTIVIFLFVVIWVLPIFINYLLSVAGIHPTIRQGVIMIVRLIMAIGGIFIIGDVLGFASDVVFAVLGTVVGVGISWAIKDQVANTIAGFLLFIFQSYGVGDEIASKGANFKGVIRSFHMQFVLIQNVDSLQITYVPNQMLWTTVIDITYQKQNPCTITARSDFSVHHYLNV
jgi:small-conductance mechanosensitive channel